MQWSAAKGTASYSYDGVGSLTNLDCPASVDVRLQYDAQQRLTNLVDAVGTTVFGYWPGGQLRTEDGPWASDRLLLLARTALSIPPEPGRDAFHPRP